MRWCTSKLILGFQKCGTLIYKGKPFTCFQHHNHLFIMFSCISILFKCIKNTEENFIKEDIIQTNSVVP